LGKRSRDIWQCDDLIAVVDMLSSGRWLMITLTTGRESGEHAAQFLSPDLAYARCNPRVCKLMEHVCRSDLAPEGLRTYFGTSEVQSGSGDGWIHWHLLAWIPPGDTRSLDEIRSDALRHWRVREESVDPETGEVSCHFEPIGAPHCQKFEWVHTREGAARYITKYITKQWPAFPEWILKREGRWRCMRPSVGAFVMLERIHRHQRRRGSRPVPRHVRRRARSILERMASSGTSLNAYVRRGGVYHWRGSAPVPAQSFDRVCKDFGGIYARPPIGGWHRARVVMSPDDYQRLVRACDDGQFEAERQWAFFDRAADLAASWRRLRASPGEEVNQFDALVDLLGPVSPPRQAESVQSSRWRPLPSLRALHRSFTKGGA
jgi:hypothetical protein